MTGDLGADPTPTDETLIVKGSEIGTAERSIYVETMGPRGPRTYYFPRAKVSQPAEQAASRTDFFRPGATFDCYENNAGESYWIHDAAA
ncbi:MAG: hypothetical protein ACYC28_12075 [Longimicrobiales bacterium]